MADAEKYSERMAEVLRLHLIEGMSARAIAQRMGMSRNTVRRMLGRTPTMRPTVHAPRTSILDDYTPVVRDLVRETPEIKAPAVLERLRPLGYRGGITVVRTLLRRLRPRKEREAFLTLHFHPGSAMMVDWGDFGFAIPGYPRRVSALVVVLCYSRLLYLEFTLSQAFGTFVRAMDRALRFFAGTTAVDIFDNMKTVVLKHTPAVTVFNQRFLAYAAARGFGVKACNPGKAHEKGAVERPIGFVRTRFWPGRRFATLLDLNTQAVAWRDDFANNREHEETGKVPSLVYEHEERHLLKPLPPTPFETDDIEATTVTKLFRVRFDRNRYSVPPRLVGQSVVVRATEDTVSVFLGNKQVAIHPRCWLVGEDIEHPSHRARALETKARADGLPGELAGLGETGVRYFKILSAGRRSIRREMVRLVFLQEVFGVSSTASAMDEVMRTGHVGAEYVEYVMRHKRGLKPGAEPLRLGDPELDGMSFGEPDLSVYDTETVTRMTLDPGPAPAFDGEDEP